MGEIISRWSKKSLSQVINLLSGALIMILFINHFTVIDIRLDFLDFISVNYANLSESIIMWIFKLYPVKRTRERVTFEPTSPVYGR